MSVFVTDTHPLIWFFGDRHNKLSPKVLAAFESAVAGNNFIYIPPVVFWETANLERAGKIKLKDNFLHWSETLLTNSGFGIAPLEPAIINQAIGYNFNNDPFDSIIVATAAELSLPLMTKDAAILTSGVIEIYW